MQPDSFAVQPGHHTLCSIKRKKIMNLPLPYSTNCSNENLFMFRNTGYKYSKPACLTECLSEYVIRKCGCRPVEYPDQTIPLCAPKDLILCVVPETEIFATSKEKDACKKNCQQPCEHTEYETSLSNAGLQRDVFIKKLSSSPNVTVDFPFYKNFMNMSYSEKKEYIDDNIVSLDVYFGDLSYDEIEQTPVFETWTLISNLGGNFGLFLGMSILTVLEFIDFAFRRIWFIVWKH
ncbi:acid-sensing ion channel 1-like [Oculina patagonica]